MKSFIRKIYNKYIPETIIEMHRRKVMPHDMGSIINKDIAMEEYNFLIEYGRIHAIPYKWIKEYSTKNCKIFRDKKGYYSLIDDKKLYWPDSIGKTYDAAECLKQLLIEQDVRSPHHYFTNIDLNNSVLFDVGGAEGLITLCNIDRIKKAYIFECDNMWNEALHKTFEPYGEKVEIINKYVSDVNNDENTTLELFIEKHINDHIILKMDIEGMETKVLPLGLGKYMGKENISFSVCTYHNVDDAVKIKEIFEAYGYVTQFSKGYMAFGNPPSFRKGIINAYK